MSGADADDDGDPEIRKTVERSYHWIVARDRLISLWARASSWTPEEGIALAFNLDPRTAIRRPTLSYDSPTLKVPEPGDHYLDLAKRAIWDGQLLAPIKPVEFVAWADRVGLAFDDAWHEALNSDSPDLGGTSPKSLALNEDDNAADRSKEDGADEALNPKARTSLLKLVIGMAVGGYGFDPNDARSDVTRDIANDLERCGVPLKRDTILKWLREGSELLPQIPPEHDEQR